MVEGKTASAATYYKSPSWYFLANSNPHADENSSILYSVGLNTSPVALGAFQNIYVNDLIFLKNRIFVCGLEKSQSITESGSFTVAEIFESGGIIWGKDLSLESSESYINQLDLSSDVFGRLYLTLQYSGRISYEGNIFESPTSQSVLVLCVSCLDGAYLWSDQITSDQGISAVFSTGNESGLTHLAITSSSDTNWKNQPIQRTESNSTTILRLNPRTQPPSIDQNIKLDFQIDRFSHHSLDLINADSCKAYIKSGPSWARLNEINGKFSISGHPKISEYIKGKERNESLWIRIVGPLNNYTDVELALSLSLPPEWQSAPSILPPLSDFAQLIGKGSIVSFLPFKEGYLVLGNYLGSIEYQGYRFSSLSRSAGFVFYLDQNLEVLEGLNFSSSSSSSLVDIRFDGSGNPIVVGNFRGSLKVENTSLISNGGTDVFVAKLSEFLACEKLTRFGDEGDEFVTSICLGNDSIYLSGYFFGDSSFGGIDLGISKGIDGYLACVPTDTISSAKWALTFGGDGRDTAQSVVFCDDHIATVGNIQGVIDFNGFDLDTGSQQCAVISQIDLHGKTLGLSPIKSSQTLEASSLEYDTTSGSYIVYGSFEGMFSTKSKSIQSMSKDVLLCIYDKNLRILSAKNFGGLNNQVATNQFRSGNGTIYITGQFDKTFSISGKSFETLGSEDAFLIACDPNNLKEIDFSLYQSATRDILNTVTCLGFNELLIGGESKDADLWGGQSDHEVDSLFLGLFNFNTVLPGGEIINYGSYPPNSPFEMPFITFGWNASDHDFSVGGDKLPFWVKVNIEKTGNGILSGFTPSTSGIFPLEFSVDQGLASSASVKGYIEITDELLPPKIIGQEEYQIRINEKSIVPINILNVDLEDLIIATDFPDWAQIVINQGNKIEIEFYPVTTPLGRYDLELLAKSQSSKLFDVADFRVNITSTEDSIITGETVHYEEWQEYWLGTMMVRDDGWSFHQHLGWIYLRSVENSEGVWLWSNDWGWLWTETSIWEGDRGFLFSDNLSGWLYFQRAFVGDNYIMYDFTRSKWFDFRN